MPDCYYTCDLIPLDLVARRGYSPRWLGGCLREPDAPARRDALGVHPMTCPFVTKLVAAAQEALEAPVAGAQVALGARVAGALDPGVVMGDESRTGDASAVARLIVPGGCDAMRRLGDLLAANYPGRVFVLPMPRSSGEAAEKTLAADLRRLDAWLTAGRHTSDLTANGPAAAPAATVQATPLGAAEVGAPAAPGAPAARGVVTARGATPTSTATAPTEPEAAAADQSVAALPALRPPTVDYPAVPQPGGVFVVAGPLSDDSLLRLIHRLGAHVSGLESCTSPDRWRPLLGAGTPTGPGTAAGSQSPAGPGPAGPDYEALAAELLVIGMCPRRSTVDRRKHLARRLDETRPSSIIYARQSFCDPGAYDALSVASLAEERRLPYLEIEVDFPFDANGPLRTRVEAFLEAQLLDEDLLDHDLFDEED